MTKNKKFQKTQYIPPLPSYGIAQEKENINSPYDLFILLDTKGKSDLLRHPDSAKDLENQKYRFFVPQNNETNPNH